MAALASVYRLSILEQLHTCKSIHLPEVPCSLPLNCHPDFVAVSKAGNDWALRFIKTNSDAEKRSLQQWKMPIYANFVVPWGDSRHALVAAKYSWLITILDDVLDDEELHEREETLQGYMSLATGEKELHEVPNKPVLVAQAELMPEIRELMSPLLFQRLLASYRHFIGCYSTQQEECFTKDSYAVHRREDYVVKPMLNFTQMCLGLELSDKDLESEEYLLAIDAMFDHLWLVNDLFSFPKELRKGTFKNLVFILLFTDETVRTIQDAVYKISNMIQEKEREFKYYHEILTRRAAEHGNHDFLTYLQAIPTFIPGNLRWHYITSRYHGVDNPFVTGEPFSGTWLFHDHKTIILPDYKPTHPHLQV